MKGSCIYDTKRQNEEVVQKQVHRSAQELRKKDGTKCMFHTLVCIKHLPSNMTACMQKYAERVAAMTSNTIRTHCSMAPIQSYVYIILSIQARISCNMQKCLPPVLMNSCVSMHIPVGLGGMHSRKSKTRCSEIASETICGPNLPLDISILMQSVFFSQYCAA